MGKDKTKDKTSQPPPPPPTAPGRSGPPDVIVPPPPPPSLNDTVESPISSEIANSIKEALDKNPIDPMTPVGDVPVPNPTPSPPPPRRQPTPEEIAEEIAHQRPRLEREIQDVPNEFVALMCDVASNEAKRRGMAGIALPVKPGLRDAVIRFLAAAPPDPLSFASTATAAKLNEYHAALKSVRDHLDQLV